MTQRRRGYQSKRGRDREPYGSGAWTPEQWQEAVDLAAFALGVDAAEPYGLVTGPKFNVARCEHVLAAGRRRGLEPAPFEQLVTRFVVGGLAAAAAAALPGATDDAR